MQTSLAHASVGCVCRMIPRAHGGGLIGVWAEKEACAGQRGENLVTVSSRVAYLAKELVEKVSYGLKGPGRTAPLAT